MSLQRRPGHAKGTPAPSPWLQQNSPSQAPAHNLVPQALSQVHAPAEAAGLAPAGVAMPLGRGTAGPVMGLTRLGGTKGS